LLPPAPPLVTEILTVLRKRFAPLNRRHYEAGWRAYIADCWTDSFVHYRCWHQHKTLIEAAKCALAQRATGWYCIAVELDSPRELTEAEDAEVKAFRFGGVR
jgi:hypothetical protein